VGDLSTATAAAVANENRGGESVVSYLLALAEMRQLARANINPTNPVALRAIGA